jgi:RNA-directed DNA polymerase
VHIPKGAGGQQTRPIGIPTFEDKILERAVSMVLEAVYEQEFLGCSYGFRPGRSTHQALEDLWKGLMAMNGGWVLELDLRSFFDTLDHRQLRVVLRQREQDGVLLRLIGKWLNAGVLEEGQVTYPEGTPQWGLDFPLLSDIFLYRLLDEWFECVVRPRLRGRAMLFRYADDVLMVFACVEDARRVWRVPPRRLAQFGLALHPWVSGRSIRVRRAGAAWPSEA